MTCIGKYVHRRNVMIARGSFGVADCQGKAYLGVFFGKYLKLARPVLPMDLRYFGIRK